MKRTIAKIMAAAMVLSAVPAVSLPTLTNVLDVQATTIDSVADENTVYTDGSTGVTLESGETAKYSDDGLTATVYDSDGNVVGQVALSSASSGSSAAAFLGLVELTRKNNELVVDVDTTTAAKKKVLVDAVKAGANGIKMTWLTGTDVTNDKTALGAVWPGGYYDPDKKAVVSGFTAEEGNLAEGNIYFNYKSVVDNAFTVEILKGDTVSANLDDNDELRGETLNLNTIKIDGDADGKISADVVKIGAQALKKAHMKKFSAENAKRIGKGALRQCKQVTRIDLEDGQKVRKINSKAFYNDKNLKTIVIDARKLNTVGKNAFSGVKKNCKVKIRANKSKYASVVKMIKKNGGNKNLKYIKK